MYDVCVIGSGPAGGVLSKELAEAGAIVVLVEAGRMMTPEDFQYHAWPYQKPYRGTREFEAPPRLTPRNSRIRFAMKIVTTFQWIGSARWAGAASIGMPPACRFADRDFREYSLEGVEEDWPLTYQELAPCYSHVEKMIGVTGSRENLDIIPDGEFLPLSICAARKKL